VVRVGAMNTRNRLDPLYSKAWLLSGFLSSSTQQRWVLP